MIIIHLVREWYIVSCDRYTQLFSEMTFIQLSSQGERNECLVVKRQVLFHHNVFPEASIWQNIHSQFWRKVSMVLLYLVTANF